MCQKKSEADGGSLLLFSHSVVLRVGFPGGSEDEASACSVRDLYWGLRNHSRWWLQTWNSKMLAPWKKSCDKPRRHIKKQRHYFVNKGPSTQGYGFSSSHVWMWELDYKGSWAPKNWCFWTVVLKKTLQSPLDCKEIQPVSSSHQVAKILEFQLQHQYLQWIFRTDFL